ncbi:methyltransferase domain-containing protein [Pseudidiomarina insulisalsae]|uniref:23S rRNA (Uracil(1939)-C(5))-methyltransferase RlmD n=1 Tax=Pseudidiomarina insulisalsae TaxID=575789 RepID=A0A432YA67_9GAMM|nr:methyltransferase domain-containing protein [Pseudidiomarina insulisalsae]RUO57875.1 23S rRNA (uracil(1939)-C(5))-methyltransferase RlmD [Pseudidiomarina insulisalsae]
MARFYRPQQRRSQPAQALARQQVSALDHQGRGVVRTERGVRFVPGALPGEIIDLQTQGKHQGQLLKLHEVSATRVAPPCPYYANCGGCDLQHLELTAQRRHKQQVVTELLSKFADTRAQQWLPPLTADAWRYRRRVRLATHWDPKRRQLRLGLRAAGSKNIVEIQDCLIAETALTALLAPLRALLPKLSLVHQLGHIELIRAAQRLVVLRVMRTPTAADKKLLREFATQHEVSIWLQGGDKSEEAVPYPLNPDEVLPEYESLGVTLGFMPGDFLQAQGQLSVAMVEQALSLLEVNPADKILELYAGSGNFTIPLAKTGAQVTAVEGVPSMVARLQQNARRFGLRVNAQQADLEQNWQRFDWAQQDFNKVLLDPARAGASGAISEVAKRAPQRIVYVSCAPDTLARDAKTLIAAGYRLRQAQIIDMFPQTHHIECLTCFERER